MFHGRRVGAVGACAIAPVRIRLEVHDQTKSALLDNPLWVWWCAFRKRYEHVEIDVVVVVVAIWAGDEDTRNVCAVAESIGAVARMIKMPLAQAQASMLLVRGGRGNVVIGP